MLPKSQIESKLDEQITRLLDKMSHLETDSDEYGEIAEKVAKLHKLKSAEFDLKIQEYDREIESENQKLTSRIKPPSMDNILVVSANLIGILWLARYERDNVIKAPKALGFVMKPRA